jgi:hypothetical protein
MGRWTKFFQLLARKDIDGNKMNLGVAVLASFRGRHIDNLAGATLNNNKAVLPQGRALHGVGSRGTSIDGIEIVLFMLFSVSIETPKKVCSIGNFL